MTNAYAQALIRTAVGAHKNGLIGQMACDFAPFLLRELRRRDIDPRSMMTGQQFIGLLRRMDAAFKRAERLIRKEMKREGRAR
jgi:hypothetical protein